MRLLSTLCSPTWRPVRGVAAWLVALALICAPLHLAFGAMTGPLEPVAKLTKLVIDVDDACPYCGARCYCQQPTMDGPQAIVARPQDMRPVVIRTVEAVLFAVLTGPPDRPPKA
jgi:hypothetical protein